MDRPEAVVWICPIKKVFWKLSLHIKWSFPLRISSVNVIKSADLVTFTEEILNGKLHFSCSVCKNLKKTSTMRSFFSEMKVDIALFSFLALYFLQFYKKGCRQRRLPVNFETSYRTPLITEHVRATVFDRPPYFFWKSQYSLIFVKYGNGKICSTGRNPFH